MAIGSTVLILFKNTEKKNYLSNHQTLTCTIKLLLSLSDLFTLRLTIRTYVAIKCHYYRGIASGFIALSC